MENKFPDRYVCLFNNSFSFENFSIVPIRYEDRVKIMNWRNEQIYHLRQNKILQLEDQELYFKNVIAGLFGQKRPSQILFSFLNGEKLIGYGGLVHINWLDKNSEISFLMNTSLEAENFVKYWEIFLLLIRKIAFSELGFHKIYTYAFDLRPLLYIALERAGFVEEARLKDHCYFNGEYQNVVIHSLLNNFYLKNADRDDVLVTYNWVINPEIRKYSFTKSDVKFEEHTKWFFEKLSNINCHYFILKNSEHTSLGSIRVDINKKEGVISYLIDPKYQGQGLGKAIVKLLEEELKRNIYNIKSLIGFVDSNNIASLKIFRQLNYIESLENANLKFIKILK